MTEMFEELDAAGENRDNALTGDWIGILEDRIATFLLRKNMIK